MHNVLRRNSFDEHGILYLQAKLVEAGYMIAIDGKFGSQTEKTVRTFQKRFGLVEDGIVGIKTWNAIYHIVPNKTDEWNRFLKEGDIQRAADRLGVDLATVKAVNEVESRGTGFIGNKPAILFEGHVFWRRLIEHDIDPQEISNEENADILYPSWTREHYRGGTREHERLDRAVTINPEAAFESASWGLFQIMGYHWEALKYHGVKNFVDEMYKGEAQQLEAFVRYVLVNNLSEDLKNKDWPRFARKYNGPGYKKNNYDDKLRRAYDKYRDFHMVVDSKTGEVLESA